MANSADPDETALKDQFDLFLFCLVCTVFLGTIRILKVDIVFHFQTAKALSSLGQIPS